MQMVDNTGDKDMSVDSGENRESGTHVDARQDWGERGECRQQRKS